MHQLESFFWGIIAALGALVFQLIVFIGFSAYLYPDQVDFSFSDFFAIPIFIILSAIIEEVFKYLVISKQIEKISLGKSYIFNSLLVGLGFFATELLLIFSSAPTVPTRFLIEIALIHLGTAGLIGYLVATRNPKKISTFLVATIAATFFHVAYNLLILNRNFFSGIAIAMLLTILVAINLFNLIRIRTKLDQ